MEARAAEGVPRGTRARGLRMSPGERRLYFLAWAVILGYLGLLVVALIKDLAS